MNKQQLKILKQLYEFGLLFDINRRVLHPFGYTIGIQAQKDEDGNFRIKDIHLSHSDSEGGITYDSKTYSKSNDKYMRFIKSQREILIKRKELYGDYLQEPTNYQDFDKC